MLREYVISEAMHALGIPTTRSLAVAATGRRVQREVALPGAVLARVASSHLRVGSFQLAAAEAGRSGDLGLLRRLTDHAIARHHPDAADAERPALALYEAVVAAQASLVARWMLVGFVHGVMNTDNMTISGETIDYGPCAFLEVFDGATVFSSIDQGGRYAYGNQPPIAEWNLARLGEALLPLVDDDEARAVELVTEALGGFRDVFSARWDEQLAAKLGLAAGSPGAEPVVGELLALLQENRPDFTSFFHGLSTGAARDLVLDVARFDAWHQTWQALEPDVALMRRSNPVVVPRNHLVEEALDAATDGDLEPFGRLLDAVSRPYEERAGFERYAEPSPDGGAGHVTFCGT